MEVKALSGCRLADLCPVRSNQFDAKAMTLTIRPEQDKTNRERVIPPAGRHRRTVVGNEGQDVSLGAVQPGRKNLPSGDKEQGRVHPRLLLQRDEEPVPRLRKDGREARSHGLRKRAITLTTLATQSVDATAQAIGIDAQTARKYYLDAKQAFAGTELLKQMADILRLKKSDPPAAAKGE